MRPAPKTDGPRDLPDFRLWLVDQWAEGAPYQRTYAAGHLSLAAVTGDLPSVGRDMARWEHRTAQQCALWWVSGDMVDLIKASGPSVPGDYVLHLDDAPDIAGCVVFAHSIHGLDANDPDREVKVDAIVWGPVALPSSPLYGRPHPCSAIGISMYQRVSLGAVDGPSLQLLVQRGAMDDLRESGDLVHLTLDGETMRNRGVMFAPGVAPPLDGASAVPATADRASTDTVGEQGTLSIPDVERSRVVFDPSTRAAIAGHETETVWLPLGRSDWIIGESIDTPVVEGLDPIVVESMEEDRRWLAALWLLARQVNVSDRVTEMPDRPARRRSERAKMDPRVTVVKLRRLREPSDHDPGDGPGREWHHRWIVGGHWRNQPFGPGRSLRRPVWIAPYVKGPEGLPLVARPKVKALVR